MFDLASKSTGGLIWDKRRNIFYQEFELLKKEIGGDLRAKLKKTVSCNRNLSASFYNLKEVL